MTFNYKNQSEKFWIKHLKGKTLEVCRYGGTERASQGKYDKFFEDGTYYCACCGGDHPIYSSSAKYDSRSGWPSFYESIGENVILQPDHYDILNSPNSNVRIEAICSRCESHLGHVFDDGPPPTGKRHCINSAALIFVINGQAVRRTYDVE